MDVKAREEIGPPKGPRNAGSVAGIATVPAIALLLGWGGVIPFGAMALALLGGMTVGQLDLAQTLVIYGAIILSFMGGVHWGLAMAAPETGGRDERSTQGQLCFSVVPALIGWGATLLATPAGLLLLVAAFIALLAVDLTWTSGRSAPRWYGKLRAQLTAAVIVSLVAAWVSGL